jgi:thioredoxin-dependent peroxiredoxin
MKSFLIFLFLPFLILPFSRPQKLKEGQSAPSFTVIDIRGDTISLNELKGQKILLAFFRYANCPACNSRMHELIEHHDEIRKAGYSILAVFESGNNTLKEYAKDSKIPFPVIGDPDLVLYKKYELERSYLKMIGSVFNRDTRNKLKKGKEQYKGKRYRKDGSRSRLPADFVISANGTIQLAYYGKTISDHLPLQTLLNQ